VRKVPVDAEFRMRPDRLRHHEARGDAHRKRDHTGKSLGIVWKTPYRVDATTALKPGANTIEIKVINGWANRIIGDRQPNVTKTYTFTSPKFYKADAPLLPSGLLGPVQVVRVSGGKSS
jgi:hypothetical protein